jgi:hypothetical protein
MLCADTLEAYRWWNTARDPLGPTDCPPSCVAPSQAAPIWNRFFPVFNHIAPCLLPDAQYWRAVTGLLLGLCDAHEIPDPESRFPDFVCLLYRLRMVLRPRSVPGCVALLSEFRCPRPSHFLLYQSPLFVADPLLFLRGLLALLDQGDALCDQFVRCQGLVDDFFGSYLSFLNPVSPGDTFRWRHHVILGEVFCRILERAARFGTCSPSCSAKFCDSLIASLGICPAEFAISAVRWIVMLTKMGLGKADSAQIKDRIKALLVHLRRDSPAFPCVCQFLLICDARLIGGARLCDCFDLTSLDQIALVDRIAIKCGVLSSIIRLAKAAIANTVLHRASFQAIRNILGRNPNDSALKDWMTVYVSRLTIFVALATRKEKYTNRCVLICESLYFFLNMQIAWLREAVLAAGVALMVTKSLPPYFTSFIRMFGDPNQSTVCEFNAFVKQKIHLKEFPFEPAKLVMVAPVVGAESVSAVSFLPLPPLSKCRKHGCGVKHIRPSGGKKAVAVIRLPNLRRRRSCSS